MSAEFLDLWIPASAGMVWIKGGLSSAVNDFTFAMLV